MRRTKIIATVGPSTDNPETLEAVLFAGVDVVRLNAAHSGPEALAKRLAAVRAAEQRIGRHVGVLVDLPGPKIRVGDVSPGTVLERGQSFTLEGEECVGDTKHACITYNGLADDVHPGDRLLLDDGRLELAITGISGRDVLTRVEVGGPLLSNKGVNAPGVTLGVDSITDYDREIVDWVRHADVDFVGQSFVRSAADVTALRELLGPSNVPIVAKIEKFEAVEDLCAVLAVADAVMVARGDLGVETSPEAVPVLQRRIIAEARKAGKPVVVATQMLDSMTTAPRPTRAEASDVANAIFDRADAVMLSGETAVGEYPLEAVETMARIASAAEDAVAGGGWDRSDGQTQSVQEAVSAAVCDLASDLRLTAIVPITQSGATARAVAKHRPDAPIAAATTQLQTARQLGIVWGVRSVVVPFAEDNDTLLDEVCEAMKANGVARSGEKIALTAGRAANAPGGTDFILVREV
ncbi:MAG: pyruvate kinase [Coriobacteriia bacterium]|nr:pyruvate kinase [Coriobacteriia bacterium]